jgi:photosystem II stability/assembly factor-like uncharacterized protein
MLSRSVSKKLLPWLGVVYTALAASHSPHDVIDDLTVTKITESSPPTLYIQVAGQLRRSQNGGYSWQDMTRGLDNRWGFTSLAAAPVGEGQIHVLATTDGDGVYLSLDGGDSWNKSNGGLSEHRLTNVLVSPRYSQDRHIVVTDRNGNIHASNNGGQSWAKKYSHPDAITALCFCDETSDSLTFGDQSGNVFVISNDGKPPRPVTSIERGGNITRITAYDSGETNSLLIGTEKQGIYRILGDNKTALNNGLSDLNIRDILPLTVIDGRTRLLVSTWRKGVFESTDEGQSWRALSTGLTSDRQADQDPHHKSPHFRNLAAVQGKKTANTIYLGAFTGLFTLRDDNRWQELESLSVKRIIDTTVQAAENDHHLAISTYGAGAYLLDSGNQQWQTLNKGLDNTRLTGIRFSPDYLTDGKLYTASRGVMYSWNADSNGWESRSLQAGGISAIKRKLTGFLHHRLGFPASLSTDLLTPEDRVIPFPVNMHIGKGPAGETTIYWTTRRGGILKFDANQNSLASIPANGIKPGSLLLSPDFSHDNTIIAASPTAMLKSRDKGNSWTEINTGFSALRTWHDESGKRGEQNPSAYADFYATHLAAGMNAKGDVELFAGTGAGLFRSYDMGHQWLTLPVNSNGRNNMVLAMAISPDYATDQTVIVSLKGKGLYKSSDGGNNFFPWAQALGQENQAIRHLQFSPHFSRDKILYAGSYETIYRSNDAGLSWASLARPVRYENNRGLISWHGEWETVKDAISSGKSYSATKSPGAAASFYFTGTEIRWIGSASPSLDVAIITIDGKTLPADRIHQKTENGTNTMVINDLSEGAHHVEIKLKEVNGSAKAKGRSGLVIDALEVIAGKNKLTERQAPVTDG